MLASGQGEKRVGVGVGSRCGVMSRGKRTRQDYGGGGGRSIQLLGVRENQQKRILVSL